MTFEKKCPAGKIEINYFIELLSGQGIHEVTRLSDNTLIFQSRDIHTWKFWDKLAMEVIEPYFYYSILELKNSNCQPIGPIFLRESSVA